MCLCGLGGALWVTTEMVKGRVEGQDSGPATKREGERGEQKPCIQGLGEGGRIETPLAEQRGESETMRLMCGSKGEWMARIVAMRPAGGV